MSRLLIQAYTIIPAPKSVRKNSRNADSDELGPEPVPSLPSQRVALPELWRQRVAQDATQSQASQSCQEACVGFLLPPPCGLDRLARPEVP